MAASINEPSASVALSELTALLSPSSPAAPEAAEAALALSGSASGRALLAEHPAALSALSALAASASRGARPALSALVNASSEPAALEPLLAALPSLVPLLPSSGAACGVLANLSRDEAAAPRVLRALGPGAEPLLLRALSAERPPAELGALLCNLSQAPEGRQVLLEPAGRVLRRLLALLRCPEPELRRGIVGALRNCCFQHENHERLLSPDLEALPLLLLPLAGPEELPEEEMEQLPVDLQYLPPEHQREEEPEIRKMLLETLMLLAATGAGRAALRGCGAYLVLRELHGWERHRGALRACSNLIQVLIGEEPEAGMENLLEVPIPEPLQRHLRDLDSREEEEEEEEEGASRKGSPRLAKDGRVRVRMGRVGSRDTPQEREPPRGKQEPPREKQSPPQLPQVENEVRELLAKEGLRAEGKIEIKIVTASSGGEEEEGAQWLSEEDSRSLKEIFLSILVQGTEEAQKERRRLQALEDNYRFVWGGRQEPPPPPDSEDQEF